MNEAEYNEWKKRIKAYEEAQCKRDSLGQLLGKIDKIRAEKFEASRILFRPPSWSSEEGRFVEIPEEIAADVGNYVALRIKEVFQAQRAAMDQA
jgi:hypothetical protein